MTTEEQALNTIYRRERLQNALAKMPSRYSQLVVVMYLLGYKQEEIAGMIGVSKQRVQQHIEEFRKRNGLFYSYRSLGKEN